MYIIINAPISSQKSYAKGVVSSQKSYAKGVVSSQKNYAKAVVRVVLTSTYYKLRSKYHAPP